MNKETKYRAWHIKRKKMYFLNDLTLKNNWIGCNARDVKTDLISDSIGVNNFLRDEKDFELMQFIGKKDKFKVDIYDGDYLVDYYPIDDEDLSKGMNESLLPVVWCNKTLSWCVDTSFSKDGSSLVSVIEYFGEHLEVRGNIYEN